MGENYHSVSTWSTVYFMALNLRFRDFATKKAFEEKNALGMAVLCGKSIGADGVPGGVLAVNAVEAGHGVAFDVAAEGEHVAGLGAEFDVGAVDETFDAAGLMRAFEMTAELRAGLGDADGFGGAAGLVDVGGEDGPVAGGVGRALLRRRLRIVGVGEIGGGAEFGVGLGEEVFGIGRVAAEMAVVGLLGGFDFLEGGDDVFLGAGEVAVAVGIDVDDGGLHVLGVEDAGGERGGEDQCGG